MIIIFATTAIALYFYAATKASQASKNDPQYLLDGGVIGIGAVAIVCHGITLHQIIVTEHGLNLGVFAAASLVGWIVSLLSGLIATRKPVASLATVVLPATAVMLILPIVFSSQNFVPNSVGIAFHIGISLVAYSLFALAALQALFLSFARIRLKNHTPVLGFFPPLAIMEIMLFQITGVAFVLLTIGLATGVVYIENISDQNLAHKIVFTVLAWITFAALLIGRYYRNWRGTSAINSVAIGFVMLAFGFFGTKIVLELIL
ncbi:MAG: inner membrane protein YpjD [Gammaproteobacteria bacterium]